MTLSINDIQHNDTQHKNCIFAECRYAESVTIMNLVTPKAGAEHELLSNKQATVPKHLATLPIALQI